jgi:hypothetical protein
MLNTEMDIVELVKHLRISRMIASVHTNAKQRELVKFFDDYCLDSGESGDGIDRVTRKELTSQYLLREDRHSRYEDDDFIEDSKKGNLGKAFHGFDPKQDKTDKAVYENIVNVKNHNVRKGYESMNVGAFLSVFGKSQIDRS